MGRSCFAFYLAVYALAMVAVGGQETAQFWGTCDDYVTLEVANDGANYVDITSSLSGDPNNWGDLKMVTLSGITSITKLRITCANVPGDAGAGGLIASIEYGGSYYSTNGDQQNYGYFTLESASSNLDTTVTPQNLWGSNILQRAPYNAQWTWTCGKGDDWSACPAGNIEVYVFDFQSVSARFRGTCDDYLTLEVANDGVNYVDITSFLDGNIGYWSQIKSVDLSGITSITKLRITCVDVAAAGGFMASIEYGGVYYSTNGDAQNYGYFVLQSATNGLASTVTPQNADPAWTVSELTSAPYNAQWTWTCGETGDWSGCPAPHTEVYVFGFEDIPSLSGSVSAEAGGQTFSMQCQFSMAIVVTSATYGGNCGVVADNALARLQAACDGFDTCSYTISADGWDPAFGCAKEYDYCYMCVTGEATTATETPTTEPSSTLTPTTKVPTTSPTDATPSPIGQTQSPTNIQSTQPTYAPNLLNITSPTAAPNGSNIASTTNAPNESTEHEIESTEGCEDACELREDCDADESCVFEHLSGCKKCIVPLDIQQTQPPETTEGEPGLNDSGAEMKQSVAWIVAIFFITAA